MILSGERPFWRSNTWFSRQNCRHVRVCSQQERTPQFLFYQQVSILWERRFWHTFYSLSGIWSACQRWLVWTSEFVYCIILPDSKKVSEIWILNFKIFWVMAKKLYPFEIFPYKLHQSIFTCWYYKFQSWKMRSLMFNLSNTGWKHRQRDKH